MFFTNKNMKLTLTITLLDRLNLLLNLIFVPFRGIFQVTFDPPDLIICRFASLQKPTISINDNLIVCMFSRICHFSITSLT